MIGREDRLVLRGIKNDFLFLFLFFIIKSYYSLCSEIAERFPAKQIWNLGLL